MIPPPTKPMVFYLLLDRPFRPREQTHSGMDVEQYFGAIVVGRFWRRDHKS